MGGGTSAFFTLETTVTPNGTTAFGGTRQAFVGLQKKGLGAVSAGTQYTPIHIAVGATDPGQQNQMPGNVIYAAYTGAAAAPATEAGSTDAYTTRTANMLKLVSDQFYGFKVTGTVTANNQNNSQVTTTTGNTTTVTGGVNNQNGWGLGVDYTWQKLLVTANYQAFTSKNPYVVNNTTGVASPVSVWGTATGGSNIQDNQAYVAATYDFGILKAYAGYVNRKITSGINSNNYLKRTGQQIGVRSYITPTIESWASVGNGKIKATYGGATANFFGYQLGSNYYLSKRTNLYAIYGQSQTSSSAVTGYVGAGANQYAVGVRHTF